MLPESCLYTFYDELNGFTLTFFEGQKLINDLAITHQLTGSGFSYFRDSVLSIQPMISFLKHREGFGIYLDSDSPYFRLKLETNESGSVRTLLLPEDFKGSPNKISGICRLTKTFGQGQHPYTSVIKLDDISFDQIINNILRDSYQIDSKIYLSADSDQSVMIMKLPNLNVNLHTASTRPSLDEYWIGHCAHIDAIFKKALVLREDIMKGFGDLGLQFLKEKEVKLHCSCSLERMIAGLNGLSNKNELFDEGQDYLETRCDYCKKTYKIHRNQISGD